MRPAHKGVYSKHIRRATRLPVRVREDSTGVVLCKPNSTSPWNAGYINQDQFQKLYSETEATARMIAGLLRYLQSSDFKGAKYK
jgi:hypothetical protein